MKYTAIISADEPLTEDIIQDLKDTMFFGDDPEYAIEIEDIKLEQEPTTKNNLGVDCISRADAIRVASGYCHPSNVAKELAKLPSVTPQEPQTFKWCETCKEYDQEKHCCHRWSKVIRDTVEEMKQEQEPIKPMVEIDLYSVIKQKYIEREVLDKIRAEIEDMDAPNYDFEGFYKCQSGALQIIDKYKAEK